MQNHLEISLKTYFWTQHVRNYAKTLTSDMSGPAKVCPGGQVLTANQRKNMFVQPKILSLTKDPKNTSTNPGTPNKSKVFLGFPVDLCTPHHALSMKVCLRQLHNYPFLKWDSVPTTEIQTSAKKTAGTPMINFPGWLNV